MQNFNCCILGTENSGKSSYIKQFCTNINENKFSPFMIVCNNLNIVNGEANSDVYSRNSFTVSFNKEEVLSFSINDYAGKILQSRDEQLKSYDELISDVHNADFLILMIDGGFFSEENKEKVVKNIKRKCARFYTPLVSQCSQYHGNKLPPVLFAVTKCKNYPQINKQELIEIIKESFDGIFADGDVETPQYVLCLDSAANNGIMIPVITAIKHFVNNIAEEINQNILFRNSKLEDTKKDKQDFLNEQESRLILKSRSKMKEASKSIDDINRQIEENKSALSNHPVWNHKRKIDNLLATVLNENVNLLIYGFDGLLTAEADDDNIGTGCLIVLAIIAVMLVVLFIANSVFRKIVIYASIGIVLFICIRKIKENIINNTKNK